MVLAVMDCAEDDNLACTKEGDCMGNVSKADVSNIEMTRFIVLAVETAVGAVGAAVEAVEGVRGLPVEGLPATASLSSLTDLVHLPSRLIMPTVQSDFWLILLHHVALEARLYCW